MLTGAIFIRAMVGVGLSNALNAPTETIIVVLRTAVAGMRRMRMRVQGLAVSKIKQRKEA